MRGFNVQTEVMKKRVLYLSILLLPFICMIAINEITRLKTTEKSYKIQDVTAINPARRLEEKCTWGCHNDTEYCKQHHVKLAKPYFDEIDPIYFGIINTFKATGDYGLANIIFLVILIPLLLYFLLIRSISMQIEIRRLKKE